MSFPRTILLALPKDIWTALYIIPGISNFKVNKNIIIFSFRFQHEEYRIPQQLLPFGFQFQQFPNLFPVPAVQSICPSPMSPGLLTPRFYHPLGLSFPTLNFSQKEVDMVLYGYTKNKEDEKSRHALSGLRSGDLSYGMSIKLDVFLI